jgi:hypothetical protein
MPSITYWNRLEPMPITTDGDALLRAVAAEVRDPLWFLARQWQLGELKGEDAASPAFAEARVDLGRIHADANAPMERAAMREGVASDPLSAVELGFLLEDLVGLPFVDACRTSFPFTRSADPDASLARFEHVVARATNGWDAVRSIRIDIDAATALLAPVVTDRPPVRAALASFVALVDDLFGADSGDHRDASSWQPERLHHGLQVQADTPLGEEATLSVAPDADGVVDWWSFDITAVRPREEPTSESVTWSVIPSFVRFRGMPNHRYWDFEAGTTDFGAVHTELSDLARLIVTDFMLVHGNDWFVLPFDQPVGTLASVRAIVVHDVFGGTTTIERADDATWSMFTTSAPGERRAPVLVIPPSAGPARQAGPVLEEVRFVRDDTANLAWAIEGTVSDGLGQPRVTTTAPSTPEGAASSMPRYRIQTDVPRHWFPLVPVAIDPARGSVQLERASLLDAAGDPIAPSGRILRPESLGGSPYVIREEEVPRTGVQVRRVAYRTRWIDGSSHFWIQPIRAPGRGEGHSGLLFDVARES